ncbi:hypothetical protein P5G65_36300 [Paenibacillus chondroitinus]|uniref:Uncharacterized protein n=1 Tax=Paenibacillus chondroitinus TaxID=59842 RepID=A0ABU6DPU2_9BACL|nr:MULTISPECIES: hypothetical protein [Paenibacillus]MCY9660567.1 hypothetical protein [Paenibacillus anseongense]MEB4799327.1 hypothetical protein [Paenibacillus chondroitinus]
MRWVFQDRVLSQTEDTIELNGQFSRGYSSAILTFPQVGKYELIIRLAKGILRVNHLSFTDVELGFGNPSNGQPAHYDLGEPGTHSLVLNIGRSLNRVDQISFVNPRWRQEVSFHYQVLNRERKT